ncbi:MAG: large ribosomal subunit protein bL28 [Patescibacteria group bacterium]
MSKVCALCEKSYLKGNSVPRGIGRRVTNRAIKRQQVNLRNKKFNIGGTSVHMRICSSCLKRIKVEEKAVINEKNAKLVSYTDSDDSVETSEN